MKKTVLNGQVLSEKEMKEVKGGAWIIVANPPQNWICDVCGCPLTNIYHEPGGAYVSVCDNCGSEMRKEKEE